MESVFVEEDGMLVPTGHATGPWDHRALHGGAPAALIANAFERTQPGGELRIGRLSFELLRPIPSAPLTLRCSVLRPGRRVQELAAELIHEEEVVCRAKALRVTAVPDDVEEHVAESADGDVERDADRDVEGASVDTAGATRSFAAGTMPPMESPESGQAVRFALDEDSLRDSDRASFATSAMEMRWLTDPWALGPGKVWMRMRMPILPQSPLTPITRLAATADFGNGVSAELRFDRFLFINADLSIHLWRPPQGEWIGLDARTLLHPGGSGVSESVIHDLAGPVGRAFQTLVVQPR